jgi:acetoin utilization protein AcuB
MMRVRDVTAGQVTTIASDASLSHAADLMRARGLRHLPVVDHGRLVGLLSDLDLDAAWPSAVTTLTVGEIAHRVSQVRVESAMKRDVVTVRLETPIVEAARLLRDRRVGALPVVRRGEVVGIVTEGEILAAMAKLLEGSDARRAHSELASHAGQGSSAAP